MNCEALIQLAFDLAKFHDERRLQAIIRRVGAKYGLSESCVELSDEEIEVWAAGDPSLGSCGKEPGDDRDSSSDKGGMRS